MSKQQIILLLACILLVGGQQNQNCLPNGIKLSLGDNFDRSSYYNKEKLLSAPRHDYTITYFTKVKCPQNYVEVYSNYQKTKKFTLLPIITKFFQGKDERDWKSVQTRKQDYESYVYEYQIDAKVLALQPDSLISYSCFYLSDDSQIKLEKGTYEFYHPDYSVLNSREFKFAWIADYDINPSEVDNFIDRKLGQENMSLMDKYIKQDRKNYVAIVGGGDYAYDLMDDNGKRGEEFLKAGEFSYATIPFVTVAGNHEEWYEFDYYKTYFRNPRHSISKSDYYTLSLGELLLVGINTNKFVKNSQNANQGLDREYYDKLLKWLDNTLLEMKNQHRWIIVYSHQNIYCFEDFPTSACYSNPKMFYELEDILVKHKVDIYLSGHVHAYERMHPFYKGETQYEESDQCQLNRCSVYKSPKAPVYVVDGTGGTYHYFPKDQGCNSPFIHLFIDTLKLHFVLQNLYKQTYYSRQQQFENKMNKKDPGGKITVASDRSLGFSTVSVKNSTHLVFEHILSLSNFSVFDTFTIYKPLSSDSPHPIPQVSQYNSSALNNDDLYNFKTFIIVFFILFAIIVVANLSIVIWIKSIFKSKQQASLNGQQIKYQQPDIEGATANQL